MPASDPLLPFRVVEVEPPHMRSESSRAVIAEGDNAGKCTFGCNSSLFLGICMIFVLVGLYMGLAHAVNDDR